MYKVTAAAASNTGKLRENNEDNFYLNGLTLPVDTRGTYIVTDETDKHCLCAICDGMGGVDNGEIASAIAVDVLHDYSIQLKKKKLTFETLADSYTRSANESICAEIDKNGGVRMGTTLVLLYLKENLGYICNLGDSRAYLYRNGITRLSRDHSKVQRMVDAGMLSEELARKHSDRNIITQHLGIFPDEMIIEPYLATPVVCEPGDVFLLCSDGLTDMLEDVEIEEFLTLIADPREAAKALVNAANQRGGFDNITVIVATIEGKKTENRSVSKGLIPGARKVTPVKRKLDTMRRD